MRFRAAILWTLVLLAALAAPAAATPCQKPRQLKLLWDAAKGEGQLVFVTYGCKEPPTCPAKAGTLATKLPVKITVRAGDATLFATELHPCAEVDKCKSLNSGGCPAGTDAHKAAAGLVKYSYQRRGMASVMARVRGSMTKPAETKGPVVVTITDGAGYANEITYTRCRFSSRPTSTTMICR